MVAQANSQAAKILEVADDPRLSKGTKEFLKVLNSGGVALEKLTPLEAHQVLVDAQASVPVDLSGIEESEKTALKAKEKGGSHIKLQILMWPLVDADFETNSYHQFGDQRFLSVPTMKWMYDMYIADPEKRKDIYASPLQATVEQLKGLPRALIVVAESDILHDEGTSE